MKLDIELLNRIKNEVAKELNDNQTIWTLKSSLIVDKLVNTVAQRYSEEVNKKPISQYSKTAYNDLLLKYAFDKDYFDGAHDLFIILRNRGLLNTNYDVDALNKRIEELESELTIIHDQFNGSGFFGNIVIRIKKLLNPSTNGK